MTTQNVTTRTINYTQEVRKADPNWDVDSRKSPEYEFSRRKFERLNKNFLPYTFVAVPAEP